MALAIYYEDLIRQGHVHDYAEIATLGHVTRARVTQIMILRLLAPDLQEQLRRLLRRDRGRDAICLPTLQSVSPEFDWDLEKQMWTSVSRSILSDSHSFENSAAPLDLRHVVL